MVNTNIYEILKQLEIKLDKSIQLLGNYVMVMPREILSTIDLLEKEIPQELLKAKRELIRNGLGYTFKAIDELRDTIERSFQVIPNRVIVIDKSKILTIIDNIYTNLPVDVQESRALLKS